MEPTTYEPLPKTYESAKDWSWLQFLAIYNRLASQNLNRDNLDAWLVEWKSLRDLLEEIGTRLEIATTIDTTDAVAQETHLRFVREIAEPRNAAEQALKQKLLDSGLTLPSIEVSLKRKNLEVAIFREENLPRFTQLTELGNEFDQLVGAQTIEWDGKTVPLSMVGPLLLDPDREIRERAWRAKHERILADRSTYNSLWTRMMEVRQTMAKTADKPNYQAYRWDELGRLDYGPQDVAEFRDTIRAVVVPATQRIYERRTKGLGLPSLRPWDTEVNPLSSEVLRPFEDESTWLEKTTDLLGGLDPQFGDWMQDMRHRHGLDLMAKEGKANGGYCAEFSTAKLPFIFMNASGTHDDLQTLFHEAGHCFHAYEGFTHRYHLEAEPPIEFCEVASMGMEMLAQPHLESFYPPHLAAIAQIQHLENCLLFLPYMAVVDGFQDWAYNHPDGRDPFACDQAWKRIWREFMAGINMSGLEAIEETGWHRKLHIFQVPLYYVEYGLAQIGAFQVRNNAERNQEEAVRMYREGLKLGSTVGLPELFAAVGGRFAFDRDTLKVLVEQAETRIETLLQKIG
jgi:oligoendopeptidase F